MRSRPSVVSTTGAGPDRAWGPPPWDRGALTRTARENSDVLPPGSVAVAVMYWPAGTAVDGFTVKLAFPAVSVVTVVKPRKRSPSLTPVFLSAVALANSSTRNVVFGVLFSAPWMVTVVPSVVAL